MDISQITDINQLKAMAYDQMALREQSEHNLRMLNARIAEVQAAEPQQFPVESPESTPASTNDPDIGQSASDDSSETNPSGGKG